jgi:signal peptide peptidase SppA
MREAASKYFSTESETKSARFSESNVQGGVAVIPLKGVLTPHTSLLAMLFGMGSGLQMFRENLREAVGSEEISKIVLDIDSPGGLVDLVPETAAEVRAANAQKPITAVSNTLTASGAYWIASQAGELVVTPSGEVGSIGVFTEHHDLSKALEMEGVNPTLISAGKFKVEGNPYEPLDDEARQALQQGVDDFYSLFVKDVAKGRGASVSDVKSGFGQGRVETAKRAVDSGLADRVETIEGTVTRLLGGGNTSTRTRSLLGASDASEVEDEPGDSGKVAYTSDELRRVVDTLATPQH